MRNCKLCGHETKNKTYCSRDCRLSDCASYLSESQNKRRTGELPSGRKGKKNSTEHNQKISNSLKGNPALAWRKGKPLEDSTREKIGLALVGKHQPKLKGRKRKDWEKEKISSGVKNMYEKHPEIRDKISQSSHRRWSRDGERDRASLLLKQQYSDGERVVPERTGIGNGGYVFNRLVGKNIWLRSSYEIKYAKFLDAIGEPWLYEPIRFKLNKSLTYMPDFYLVNSDTWVETKGYESEIFKQKFHEFHSLYPRLKKRVLYRKDIVRIEKWCKERNIDIFVEIEKE